MIYLQDLDLFYSSSFNFTAKGKNKFQTYLGGVLSLLTILLIYLFSFNYGYEYIFKNKPIVFLENEIVENLTTISLNEKNSIFPWRIEDGNNKVFNFSNLIFPDIHLKFYAKNKLTKEIELKQTLIDFTNCDNSYKTINDLSNFHINEYFCFKFSNQN